MNTNDIEVNTQSSIRIKLDKVLYFDPFKIEETKHDANIIFITHAHYDHFDIDSINNIKNDNTIIVAPSSMESEINALQFKEYIYLNPEEEKDIDDIHIKAVRAYNNEKPFHPKMNNWLGYVITYNDVSCYIAGDTDKTIDNEKVFCDIAFLPIGGHYTMDVNEAVELIKEIRPKVVIPTHYGSIVGSTEDAKKLKEALKEENIEVIEKLEF